VHVAFKIPYVYDCITKLCRTQAEVMVLEKEKPGIGSIRGLNLAAVRPTAVQLTDFSFGVVA
jgi:hypothetical protein